MLGMVLNFGNSVKAGYTQGFEFTNSADFTNNLLNNPNPYVNSSGMAGSWSKSLNFQGAT
jgi:hypothetical protein